MNRLTRIANKVSNKIDEVICCGPIKQQDLLDAFYMNYDEFIDDNGNKVISKKDGSETYCDIKIASGNVVIDPVSGNIFRQIRDAMKERSMIIFMYRTDSQHKGEMQIIPKTLSNFSVIGLNVNTKQVEEYELSNIVAFTGKRKVVRIDPGYGDQTHSIIDAVKNGDIIEFYYEKVTGKRKGIKRQVKMIPRLFDGKSITGFDLHRKADRKFLVSGILPTP